MNMKTGSFAAFATLALVWALVWAFPGGVIEAIDNIAPAAHGFTRQIDMWMQTLGLPGFVGGAVFSVLLLITEGRRSVAEIRALPSAGWGAVAGLLVGGFVIWVVAPGLSQSARLAAALLGVATLLGALSGFGSRLVFRYAAAKRFSAASAAEG